jgi:arginyl-tRNA--protein-N-Asp/Glu arginylyltransferase
MPSERFRTISLNNFIERNPQSWGFIENEPKSFIDSYFDEAYLESKYEDIPRVEYVGKVPLNRPCAHGKIMEQIKIHTENISIQCMNELINNGWRREGNNFYKCITECCPTFALRIDPKNFKLGRQHRKILNHFADFVKHDNAEVKKPKRSKQTAQDDHTLEAYVQRILENCEAHKFEIRLVRPGSKIFKETYEESFALFKKYQEHIHKNQFTKEDFERLVVETPLKSFGNEENPEIFGSFHRQYLLDGRLIGVEMFDVLPNYLLAQSSFYDIDMSHHNLGTFMILEPMLYTQQLSKLLGRTLYYSTGLYNHCFKKHHYKLTFADEILCTDTPNWAPLTKDIVEKLDAFEPILSGNLFVPKTPEIWSINCLYSGKIHNFGTLQALLSKNDREVLRRKLKEYVLEAGVVAKNMILCY